jgi:hypothetical protein
MVISMNIPPETALYSAGGVFIDRKLNVGSNMIVSGSGCVIGAVELRDIDDFDACFVI